MEIHKLNENIKFILENNIVFIKEHVIYMIIKEINLFIDETNKKLKTDIDNISKETIYRALDYTYHIIKTKSKKVSNKVTIFWIAMIIANKYINDSPLLNEDWSIFLKIKNKWLVDFEREFLKEIDWNLR